METSVLRTTFRAAVPDRVVAQVHKARLRRRRRALERRLPDAGAAFKAAYIDYWKTGVVPPDAGDLLFLATWGSEGTYPRSLPPVFAAAYVPEAFSAFPDELLKNFDVPAAVAGLRDDGYYVAPFLLPGDVVDDILATLERGPATPRADGLTAPVPGPPDPSAPTWWMESSNSLTCPSVRRLLVERQLAHLGGEYLGNDPLVMSVALWKSFGWGAPDKTSAQQFHYDDDRACFVKMFLYLTDVDEANGPHTYVPRSHGQKPSNLLSGDRLSDAVIKKFYPQDTWKVITGSRGTLFFADTRGFHKGGWVAQGERAMFQINIATDRFGVQEPTVGSEGDVSDDMRSVVASAPRYFSGLYTLGRPEP